MFEVYILRSPTTHRYYVGSTDDLEARIARHNAGEVRSTKAFRPWVMVYKEVFETRTEARKRENQIKSYKGGRAFHRLITGVGTEAVKRGRL